MFSAWRELLSCVFVKVLQPHTHCSLGVIQNILQWLQIRVFTFTVESADCSFWLSHSAEADTVAALEVFLAQLERYDELPKTVEELALISNYSNPLVDITGFITKDAQGELVFSKGKWKGHTVKSCLSYCEWILKQDSFSQSVKNIIREVQYS